MDLCYFTVLEWKWNGVNSSCFIGLVPLVWWGNKPAICVQIFMLVMTVKTKNDCHQMRIEKRHLCLICMWKNEVCCATSRIWFLTEYFVHRIVNLFYQSCSFGWGCFECFDPGRSFNIRPASGSNVCDIVTEIRCHRKTYKLLLIYSSIHGAVSWCLFTCPKHSSSDSRDGCSDLSSWLTLSFV